MGKSIITVNRTTNSSAVITMNDEKLKEITSFKNLGATLSKDSTSTAVIRIKCHVDRSDGQT
ncbi:hypothetical protein DPMN_035556 [Dreissena polymorpha]|uniref:Uncharacterized protein n=1 Tax=Dreissena polymorpha TaxID=45954 RepID=A0A9D4RKP5_DREPO|nr:hypothetical protein DPMN_035556 [Dreissena polymorpha]